MPQGHKAKTGNAPIRKVGHTNGSRYGQDGSAKVRGSNSGSENTYK
jgi:hypothetical protein